MHVTVTRIDLGTFAHIHPEVTGTPGVYTVEATFPTAGEYLVHTEFRRNGQMGYVLDTHTVTVAGRQPSPAPVRATDVRSWTGDGSASTPRATPPRRHQRPRPDLRPRRRRRAGDRPGHRPAALPGAAGHVVVMRADGSTFAHRHAETFDTHDRPVLALPGTRSVPTWTCMSGSTGPGPTGCGRSSSSPTAQSSPPRSSSTPRCPRAPRRRSKQPSQATDPTEGPTPSRRHRCDPDASHHPPDFRPRGGRFGHSIKQ